ncbi:hypothetical protein [Cryobacterium tepidiphilum]|uniref:hypothetical protein n=1 Tax=Cryobacterium tepidiphilum TaxID=2486026 RepID=UPI001F24B43F|nr:hypothetical protein [Cryobacterium tepidiphilum]
MTISQIPAMTSENAASGELGASVGSQLNSWMFAKNADPNGPNNKIGCGVRPEMSAGTSSWVVASTTILFSSPAMPKNLTTEEEAAWKLALDGETGGGADYHWEDAGCWGSVVHQLCISS